MNVNQAVHINGMVKGTFELLFNETPTATTVVRSRAYVLARLNTVLSNKNITSEFYQWIKGLQYDIRRTAATDIVITITP